MIWKNKCDVVVIALGLDHTENRNHGSHSKKLAPSAERVVPPDARDGFEARGEPLWCERPESE